MFSLLDRLNNPALSDPGRESTKRAAERVFSCFTGSQTSALENSRLEPKGGHIFGVVGCDVA